MKDNDKINVAEYLKDLNINVKQAIAYHHIKADQIDILNCKKLAEYCGFTPATITNLKTSSKFYVIWQIADKILDAYFDYFEWDYKECVKEYPDEYIHQRDISYVIHYLTDYYTDEFLR